MPMSDSSCFGTRLRSAGQAQNQDFTIAIRQATPTSPKIHLLLHRDFCFAKEICWFRDSIFLLASIVFRDYSLFVCLFSAGGALERFFMRFMVILAMSGLLAVMASAQSAASGGQQDFLANPPALDLTPPPVPPPPPSGDRGRRRGTSREAAEPRPPAGGCNDGGACYRPDFGQLPLPRLGSATPPLSMGIAGASSVEQVQRNAVEVDRITEQIQGNSASPGSPVQPIAPQPRSGQSLGPCGSGRELSDLLSHECLASMRSLRPGSLSGFPLPLSQVPPPQPVAPLFTCGVALFPTPEEGRAAPTNGVVSFQTKDVVQCINAGVRLGFGVPGRTNITILTPQGVSMGVTCHRPHEAPATVNCAGQENLN